jgi:hypothetical protein
MYKAVLLDDDGAAVREEKDEGDVNVEAAEEECDEGCTKAPALLASNAARAKDLMDGMIDVCADRLTTKQEQQDENLSKCCSRR